MTDHVLYVFGGMRFNPELRELERDNATTVLTNQEAMLLTMLVSSRGRVVTKESIAAVLWPDNHLGEFDMAIAGLISRIRRALGEDGQQPRFIKTISKAGYRLICDVEVCGVDVHKLAESDARLKLNEALMQRPASFPIAADVPRGITASPANVSQEQSPKERRRWWVVAGLCAFLFALSTVLAIFRWRHSKQVASDRLIEVLPFTVLGVPETPLLGQTLREEVADVLVSIPGLEVQAATASALDARKDSDALAKRFSHPGLDLMLSGKVAVTAERYEADFELIRATDAAHLTSFHYEGARIGLSVIPEELGPAVFDYLRRQPNGGSASLEVRGGSTLEAYDLAFQAATLLRERSTPSLQKAIGLYRKSIERDPNLGKAYSGLAESAILLAKRDKAYATKADYELARSSAQKAIALDPENAQAHSALGLVLIESDWDLSHGSIELKKAESLSPGLSASHTKLVFLDTMQGNFEEAERELNIAHTVDPENATIYGTGVFLHISDRNYAAAIQDGQRFVQLRPDWGVSYERLGWAFWFAGRHKEAVTEWIAAAKHDRNTAVEAWESKAFEILSKQGVQAYARLKRRDFATVLSSPDFLAAEWAAFAGDRDGTLNDLEVMFRAHDSQCLVVPFDPTFDFLKKSTRYRKYLEDLHSSIN